MSARSRPVRISDLVSSKVVDADGRDLGKVVDIRVSADGRYEVLELLVGSTGWLNRLNLARLFQDIPIREPARIPWSTVDRFAHATIHLKRDPGASGPRERG